LSKRVSLGGIVRSVWVADGDDARILRRNQPGAAAR